MQASPRSLRKLGCARSEEPGGVYLMRTTITVDGAVVVKEGVVQNAFG